MTNQNKIYRVKYDNGDVTGPLTKEQAKELMIIRRGEIVTDHPGWPGCIPALVAILIVIMLTIFAVWVLS